jgi:catechol 2,3-dioxygenase-like lactoylglutathione lyase family enzyme
MPQSLAAITLLVHDYDEAIAYYTQSLGFTLAEGTPLPDGKRWVRVHPPGQPATSLLLARAATPDQSAQVGHQSAGRVFLFLHTDNFDPDYHALLSRNVHFTQPPRQEPYGQVAVFQDLYGNRWDLLQPTNPTT